MNILFFTVNFARLGQCCLSWNITLFRAEELSYFAGMKQGVLREQLGSDIPWKLHISCCASLAAGLKLEPWRLLICRRRGLQTKPRSNRRHASHQRNIKVSRNSKAKLSDAAIKLIPFQSRAEGCQETYLKYRSNEMMSKLSTEVLETR